MLVAYEDLNGNGKLGLVDNDDPAFIDRVLSATTSFTSPTSRAATDADRLSRAGFEPERRFRATAVGAHALAGARLPVGSVPWIEELDVRADALAGNLEDTVIVLWSAGGACRSVSRYDRERRRRSVGQRRP